MTSAALRRRFWILTGLQWFPVGFLLPVLVLTLDERGLSIGQVGLVFMAYGLTTALLELPTGGLADEVGRKPVLMASAALHGVMALMWLFGSGFIAFFAGAFIGGTARALSTGPLEAWYVDTMGELDHDQPIRSGLAGAEAIGAIGIALSALAVSGIASIDGLPTDGALLSVLRIPPLLAALAAAAQLVAVALMVEERPRHGGSLRSVTKGVPATMARTVRNGLAAGPVRLVLLATLFIGVALASLEMLYQPFLSGLLESAAQAARLFGFLVVGLGLAGATGSALAARIPDDGRTQPATFASASFLLGAICLGAFGLAGSVGLAVALFLAMYVLNGFGFPFLQQILHAGTSSEERSTMLSAWSLTSQLGVVVTGTLIAQVAAVASVSAGLLAAAGSLLLAAVVGSRLSAKYPRPPGRRDGRPERDRAAADERPA